MSVRSFQLLLVAALSCGMLATMSACGGGSSAGTSGVLAAQAVAVSVPAADRFSPFVTTVARGTQLTFHNGDHDAHTVVSIPGDALALQLTLAPGESRTVTVRTAGLHRYYCSIHAHFDPATGQIAANPGADHPDEPMEGVLVVA